MLIVWSPLVLALMLIGASAPGREVTLGLGVLALATGAGIAIARPSRGVQDRLAGTWIVPR